MKRNNLVFNILVLILLLPIVAFSASYIGDAINVRSTKGNVQSDLNRIDTNLGTVSVDLAAKQSNLATLEALVNSNYSVLHINDTTLEALIVANKAELYNNIGTLEALFDARYDELHINIGTLEITLTAKDIELQTNLGTLEALINGNYASLYTNIGTLEANINNIVQPAINALQLNIETLEALVVANNNARIADIANITSEINIITADINNIEGLIAEITAENNLTSQEIADITAEISLIKGNLTTLEAYVNSQDIGIGVEITALKNNLTTMETLINDNYNSLYVNVSTLETLVKANYLTLGTRIDTLELKLNADILALINNMSTMETRVSSNEAYLLTWLPTTTEAGYLYYDTTEAKVKWQMVTSGGGVSDHYDLLHKGILTHAQIDTALGEVTNEIVLLHAEDASLENLINTKPSEAITKIYGGIADTIGTATGEVWMKGSGSVIITRAGNTIEIESTGGSSTQTVNYIQQLDYATKSQGTASVGFYSIYRFNLATTMCYLDSIDVWYNGIKQKKGYGLDYVQLTWDDSGVTKVAVVFNKDLADADSVYISYFVNSTSVESTDIYVPYTTPYALEQGTASVGYYGIVKFAVDEATYVTSSAKFILNGLELIPNIDYTKSQWNNGGLTSTQITLYTAINNTTDKIWMSYYKANVNMANMPDTGITTNRMGATTVNEALLSAEVKLNSIGVTDASQDVQINNNTQAIANISPEINPTIASMTDGQMLGIFCTATLAVSQNKYDVLYLSSSGYNDAVANSTTTMPCSAMAHTTGSGAQKIIRQGFIKNTSWSFTKGQLLYLSTSGGITTTVPSSGYIQCLGYAEDTNIIYFCPSPVCIAAQ